MSTPVGAYNSPWRDYVGAYGGPLGRDLYRERPPIDVYNNARRWWLGLPECLALHRLAEAHRTYAEIVADARNESLIHRIRMRRGARKLLTAAAADAVAAASSQHRVREPAVRQIAEVATATLGAMTARWRRSHVALRLYEGAVPQLAAAVEKEADLRAQQAHDKIVRDVSAIVWEKWHRDEGRGVSDDRAVAGLRGDLIDHPYLYDRPEWQQYFPSLSAEAMERYGPGRTPGGIIHAISSEAHELERGLFSAYTYENTPIRWFDDPADHEFPESDGTVALERGLDEFLAAHPHLYDARRWRNCRPDQDAEQTAIQPSPGAAGTPTARASANAAAVAAATLRADGAAATSTRAPSGSATVSPPPVGVPPSVVRGQGGGPQRGAFPAGGSTTDRARR